MFALENKWIWDFWLAKNGTTWHVYFLQADKSLGDPDLRHWNVSMGHATSNDLRHWAYLGTCFRPAAAPAWDDKTTWTGSVLQAEDGLWHLFYTGTSQADGGMKQRIGHATSQDMHSWERVGDGLILDINTTWYEEYDECSPWHDRAMRDPWVMRDPDGDGWLMYFTARQPGIAEANAGGVIGLATSPDLYQWTLQPPVYAGEQFGQMEVPQVLQLGKRWYCLFCNESAHWSNAYTATQANKVTGTHYLIADHPRGPWQVAPGAFFVGSQPPKHYAGKLVQDGEQLWFMAFLHDNEAGEFIGALSDPMPVAVGGDGLLCLGLPFNKGKA